MNLHEYQAKQLLKQYGVQVPEGIATDSSTVAIDAAKTIRKTTRLDSWAIKAQIHAGGRGKGGGIKISKSLDEVEHYAHDILGMRLITHQTGQEGKIVRKVLVEQNIYYPGEHTIEEFYISLLLNRSTGRYTFMYSKQGGVDIEETAKTCPV